MNYTLAAIFSFSIGIAGIIGVIRFNKINPIFYPFIFLIWLGLVNEIISFLLIRSGYSNAVNSNIYVLLESILIAWFFKYQGLFNEKYWNFAGVIILLVTLWVVQNFIISSIHRFTSYFNVVYSFIIVLMSIHLINRLIIREKRMIVRNPIFIICIGFILFYLCAVLIEIFWIYGLNSSKEFRFQVYQIMTIINLIVNLIYALAVLWIPRKQEYTLL